MDKSTPTIDFNWSFVDTATGETIEGMVLGLIDNAMVPASQVSITQDGTLTFGVPQNTIGGPSIVSANVWEVVNGEIISVDFDTSNFAGLAGDALSFTTSAGPVLTGTLTDGLSAEIRTGEVVFIPEPGAGWLFAVGVVGVALVRRRRGGDSERCIGCLYPL